MSCILVLPGNQSVSTPGRGFTGRCIYNYMCIYIIYIIYYILYIIYLIPVNPLPGVETDWLLDNFKMQDVKTYDPRCKDIWRNRERGMIEA